MRLYGGQVSVIAEEILKSLQRAGDLEIEPDNLPEVRLDIESVLREYIRMDREITNLARDQAAQTGQNVMRAKRAISKEKGFEVGDDALEYIVGQLIETFLHSAFVEEVYAEDHEIRKRVVPVINRFTEQEAELDKEVRTKIKNMEEGSQAWDIEYQKALGNLKRNKNLE